MTILHDYKLVNIVGKGMYGEVWKAQHIVNKKKVAIKIEKKLSGTLKREVVILRHLKHLSCIPELKIFGQTISYNYIAMELLGDTIEVYCNMLSEQEKNDEIKWVGLKMMDCLREIHENGVIHCDVTPRNFILTTDKKKVKIVDFGLARQFVDGQGHHKPVKRHMKMTGSFLYMSTHIHEGYEPCRRDDVISVIYVISYLLNSTLPWQCISNLGNIEKNQLIYQMKKGVTGYDLHNSVFSKMNDLLEYVYSLTYYDDVDYDYVSFLINTLDGAVK